VFKIVVGARQGEGGRGQGVGGKKVSALFTFLHTFWLSHVHLLKSK